MERTRRAAYLAVLRWLPASTMPGGKFAMRLRRGCVVPLLASAGSDVNIEHGALFGGGPQVALPLFQKAQGKFESFVPKNELMPGWGGDRNLAMIGECEKNN